MLRYIFMGSPDFAATILQKLCEELAPPVAVVTQEAKIAGRGQKVQPTAVETYARSQELNVLSALDVNLPSMIDVLRTFQPDLILVAAFGQILRNDLLTMAKIACLNVHASLLPKYRGAAPIQRAIFDGEARTGITIQKMAKKLDTGDILLQRDLEIDPEETSGELFTRLSHLGGECLVDAVRLIETGQYDFRAQDHSLATYAKKIEKSEGRLDWNWDAPALHRKIRAFQPWPVAETLLDGVRLKVFRGHVVPGNAERPPGTIVTDSKTHLIVHCGNGTALSLTEIQLENRKRLGISDFLTAYRGNFPHTKLGDA